MFFQAEDGIRDAQESRGLGDVYKRQISEIAEVLSTTRQNIKQIALKLQEKEFIAIEKDQKDKRVLRLRLTEKNRRYWESNKDEDEAFIRSLFNSLTDNEIKELYYLLNKLEENINQMYDNAKKGLI